jgi:hypothetical protein
VRFVIAEDLDPFPEGGTDERAFDRLMVIDGRARYGADDGSARLAVVMAVVAIVMMRRRKRTSGRQKEREAQQCRLDFLACHLMYLRPLILRVRCR